MTECAAILAIGDELTLGQSLDTNSHWLSTYLAERGIETVTPAVAALRLSEAQLVSDDAAIDRSAILRLRSAASRPPPPSLAERETRTREAPARFPTDYFIACTSARPGSAFPSPTRT